jgi:hypothetical protein
VVIPASSYSKLQNIVFTIGGKAFTLTPSQYILPQDQVSNWGGNTGTYYSLIGDLGTGNGLDFILGQKFLENYYSVYVSNSDIGICAMIVLLTNNAQSRMPPTLVSDFPPEPKEFCQMKL